MQLVIRALCIFVEAQTQKSHSGTGSGPYGPKSRFVCEVMAAAAAAVTPTKAEGTSKNPTTCMITSGDWSPQDDGIEVVLPNSSTEKPQSRKDVNAYIDGALYGPTSKKRLPVFAEICSE